MTATVRLTKKITGAGVETGSTARAALGGTGFPVGGTTEEELATTEMPISGQKTIAKVTAMYTDGSRRQE